MLRTPMKALKPAPNAFMPGILSSWGPSTRLVASFALTYFISSTLCCCSSGVRSSLTCWQAFPSASDVQLGVKIDLGKGNLINYATSSPDITSSSTSALYPNREFLPLLPTHTYSSIAFDIRF